MITLNKTPIRTCKNFLINEIEIDEKEIEKTKDKFENIKYIEFDEKIKLTENVENAKLTYGNGDYTESQFKDANKKIKIEIEQNTNKSNIIDFVFDEKNRILVDNIEIIVNQNVKANLNFRYSIYDLDKRNDCLKIKYNEEEKLKKAYHNTKIKVILKENAKLNITVVNLLGKNTNVLLNMENELKEKSELTYNYIDFGGNKRIINSYTKLEGQESKNRFNSIYLGEKEELLDYNYIAEAYGKKSDVNIEVQGAIKDKVKKNFKGTIDFKAGCTNTKGAENEYCVLLSDTAKAISLPMLLCTEEDVEGAHSTAAGKIGGQELFYIMSRGFSKKEAEKLIIRANFNEIIEGIQNDEIKEDIIHQIEYRL